jgi:peptidoglycan hydrolase-like protein with peptidoglycan-binding domain
MKKYVLLLFVFILAVYFIGCGQKKKEEEFLTMDELGAISIESPAVSELKPDAQSGPTVSEIPPPPPPTIAPPPTAASVSVKPGSADKPSSIEIQTALKNAGYYIGAIDGKIGRITTKAIEDFQEANGLVADGKVGPKTWSALAKFLTVEPVSAKKKR